MISSVDSAEAYLASLPTKQQGAAARLSTVRQALDTLGNPQDSIPAIHIAGTSGKGSTAYYAASMLYQAGYTVGLAVSPHVHSVTERSQVNGKPLPEATYCSNFTEFTKLKASHGWELTYLEFLTVFTYWLFAQLQLDYMVIEVGVGGRLDPTNAITRKNTVRIITDIGFDHMDLLGNTLKQIAEEKAGIIRGEDRVVMHQQTQEVMDTVAQVCSHAHARQVILRADTIPGSTLPAFQQRNWTLAYCGITQRLTLDGHTIPPRHNVEQSQQIAIPGRFEQYTHNGVSVVLDVAHNAQKLSALTSAIAAAYPGASPVYVVAFGGNKQAILADSIAVIARNASAIVATNFPAGTTAWHPSVPADSIMEACEAAGIVNSKSVPDAWQAYKRARQLGAPVVVTGSFYLIDGIRARLIAGGAKPKVDNSPPNVRLL